MTARLRRRCGSARRSDPRCGAMRNFCSRPCRAAPPCLSLAATSFEGDRMSAASAASRLFVPPYPRRPGPAARVVLDSSSRCSAIRSKSGAKADFERPVSIGRTIFGLRGAAHDPAAVRRIFLDNAANYRKDDLQLRILRPGLGNGLLTAEGEDWRIQRRALAPLFSPRQTAEFAPAVHRVGQAAIERMSPPTRRRCRRRRRPHVAPDARSARADAVLARAWTRAQRLSARGDELFRDDRQDRSARSAGRASVSCRG